MNRLTRFAALTLIFGLSLWLVPGRGDAGNWPRFQGPDGSGHVTEKNLPLKWTPNDVVWKAQLKGLGHSTPIVHGDRIFLTSAVDNGLKRMVFCLNRNDGSVVWEQTVTTDVLEKSHGMNGWAAASCATDGERVVAFFGPAGLHCYDVNGKKLWERNLGGFPGPFGSAASPVILGNMVIQNCDAEGESYLIALNKENGETIWKTARRNCPKGGWSTPILIDTGKRKELILNGEFGVQGYDPETGKDLWYCKSFNGRGTPIPAWGNGLLYVVNGKPGDLYAVRPGGSGDVTKTHMAFHAPRKGGRDLPSPMLVGKRVFVTSMSGVASMYDADSGKTVWTERLDGKFAASPIVIKGLIYIPNESGETLVIEPADTLKIVARNKVGGGSNEIFRASLAPSDGQIFCRSDRVLYCIGQRAAE